MTIYNNKKFFRDQFFLKNSLETKQIQTSHNFKTKNLSNPFNNNCMDTQYGPSSHRFIVPSG